MLILDFDRVLFNYGRFGNDYRRLFRSFGIPQGIYAATYTKSLAWHGGVYYHGIHLRLVKEKIPELSLHDLERAIGKLLGRSAAYVYHDAIPFLSRAKKQKRQMVLVSHGFLLQKRKIRASGLADFFQKVIVTDDPGKTEAVATAIGRVRPAQAVFIDDKKRLVEEVKKCFPDMLVIQLVRRRNQERSTRVDAVVSNLAAARQIIERR